MKIEMQRSDWYVIHKCEEPQDHKEGFIQMSEDGYAFYSSDRLSNADCEGTASEMLEIMEAIIAGESRSFKRCAVSVPVAGQVFFWSPRNSNDDDMEPVPVEDAIEMAKQAMEILKDAK